MTSRQSEIVSLVAGGYTSVRPGYKNRGVTLVGSLKDASHGASFTFLLTPAEARELADRLVEVSRDLDGSGG